MRQMSAVTGDGQNVGGGATGTEDALATKKGEEECRGSFSMHPEA